MLCFGPALQSKFNYVYHKLIANIAWMAIFNFRSAIDILSR